MAQRLRGVPRCGATVPTVRLTEHVEPIGADLSGAGRRQLLPAGRRSPQPNPRDRALDDLFEALALGVKSYYEKTGAFRSLGIALSGGRDSMLTLLVAWRAAHS